MLPTVRPSGRAPRKTWLAACRPPPAAIYWTMIVGFPEMCLRKIVVTALVRMSAEPPGGPPKTTEIVCLDKKVPGATQRQRQVRDRQARRRKLFSFLAPDAGESNRTQFQRLVPQLRTDV